MSIYNKIKDNYDSLSKTEKKIAKFCLDNYLDISNYSIANLAATLKCGEASIFRFCNKLGIDSYQDFKNHIYEEVKETSSVEKESVVTDVYSNVKKAIEFVIQNIDENELEKISSIIYKSQKIFCAGVGNSAIASEACALRFMRNGFDGRFLKDNHLQLIFCHELSEKDIAILFSVSGETVDLLYLADILREKKVPIVAITSSIVSPLAKMSDYHILVKNYAGPVNGGNLITQIAQMYVADLINTSVCFIDKKNVMKARQMTYDYATIKQTGKYDDNNK